MTSTAEWNASARIYECPDLDCTSQDGHFWHDKDGCNSRKLVDASIALVGGPRSGVTIEFDPLPTGRVMPRYEYAQTAEVLSDDEVCEKLRGMNLGRAMRWCEEELCGCVGCANRSEHLAATKEQWARCLRKLVDAAITKERPYP